MKLLLTSAGITNQTLAQALLTLAGKSAQDIKVAFIPTAANVEEGNKVAWFFHQYDDLRKIGIQWIDMIDFADYNVDWQSRFNGCGVLYLTGGNTFTCLIKQGSVVLVLIWKRYWHQKFMSVEALVPLL